MGEATNDERIQLLRSQVLHVRRLQAHVGRITDELGRRAREHDCSKFREDEFEGFARINRIAREHEYGSDEYRQSLDAERRTIDLHYTRNDHHPEHHTGPWQDMGFLEIIEMVCDWRAAWEAYGTRGPWFQSVDVQREKLGDRLTEGQWWLVGKVARWLDTRADQAGDYDVGFLLEESA